MLITFKLFIKRLHSYAPTLAAQSAHHLKQHSPQAVAAPRGRRPGPIQIGAPLHPPTRLEPPVTAQVSEALEEASVPATEDLGLALQVDPSA